MPTDLQGDSDFMSTRTQRMAFEDMNPNVDNLYVLPFVTTIQQSPHGRVFPQVLGNTPILGTLGGSGMSQVRPPPHGSMSRVSMSWDTLATTVPLACVLPRRIAGSSMSLPPTARESRLPRMLPRAHFCVQVAFQLGPCGTIPMHFHPRATEFAHVTSGSVVYGFTLDDGTGNVEQTYEQGQTAVIPQANMHFIENRSCKPARIVATLSHTDPGTTFVTEYFKFSDQALRSTLGHGLTQELIDAFRNILNDPRNEVPVADPACLQRCGVRVSAQG